MIETTNPEINVEELMERVREEAALLMQNSFSSGGGRRSLALALPPVRVLAPPPPLAALRVADPKKERIESMLREARAKSEGNPNIPKMFRRFFRKQGGYNRMMADAVALLSRSQVQMSKQLREVCNAFEGQSRWLRALAEHRQADGRWMRAAAQQMSELAADVEEIAAAGPSHESMAPRVQSHDSPQSLRQEIEALRRSMGELQARVERLQRELPRTSDDKLDSAAARPNQH